MRGGRLGSVGWSCPRLRSGCYATIRACSAWLAKALGFKLPRAERGRSEQVPVWWTSGLGCFTGSEGSAIVQPGVQAGDDPAGKARRVLIVQAGRDLDVGENVLRRWIRELSSEHGQASPGQGQVRPERQEIRRLRCEVAKLQGGTRHPREGQSTCACRHYEAEPSRALATIPAMHPVLDGAAVDAAGLRQADTSPRPSAGAAL